MFRRYSLKYEGDKVVVQFKGNVASRQVLWMGALDAMLLSGNRLFVLDVEHADVARDADVDFIRTATRHITDCGGKVAVVASENAQAQRLLKRARTAQSAPLVPTTEEALAWLGQEGVAVPANVPNPAPGRRTRLGWPLRRP